MEPDRTPTALWAELRWIVPALAAILLTPPVLGLFDRPVSLLGIPLLALYTFGIWAAAISLCAIVARRALPPRRGPERHGP